MLKVRVIPTMLWKDFGLVKGIGFDSWRRTGSVLPAIKVYTARDVDELVLVDITASNETRPPDAASVSDFTDECSIPLTVGGGIGHVDQIAALLHAGADKVSINSHAYERPDFVDEAANRFGAQCVIAGIDVRVDEDGGYSCFSHSGARPTGRDPVSWASELADRGAGEILLTSIDRDGTMEGYDLDLVGEVAGTVNVPVIASGGAGSYQDCVDVVVEGGASAVAAASIFQFTELTPAGVKEALHAAGVPVRRTFVPV